MSSADLVSIALEGEQVAVPVDAALAEVDVLGRDACVLRHGIAPRRAIGPAYEPGPPAGC